jgi:peptide deformylase
MPRLPLLRTPAGALAFFALLAGGCGHVRPLDEREGGVDVVQLDRGHPAPASVLRRRAEPVDPRDPRLPELVERLRAALERTGGVGIAGPQVGASRRVALVKLGTRPAGGEVRVETLVNPVFTELGPVDDPDYEACLSVEGVGGRLPRARTLTVAYEAVGGGRHELRLSGWDARIAQHEMDHLDGILYLDHVDGPLVPLDETRRLRDEGHRRRGWLPPAP